MANGSRSGPPDRAGRAHELMLGFAERTGLTSDRPAERYLWTDAFAVCNFLGLGQTELALKLVNQVQDTLSPRRASGNEEHPTAGGLRIGKKLPERGPDEPLDERLEWDRDGQYFHYLTKWMHALDQVARRTGEAKYNLWARELADTAHRAFTYFEPVGRDGRRMYWKMSIDLSRPLVASMGHHDPLDGYVTCLQLAATAARLGTAGHGPSLVDAAADFRAMLPRDLTTTDPLGLGGLLTDAWRTDQLEHGTAVEGPQLRDRLLDSAHEGLLLFAGSGELRLPAEHRLGFRELGLAVGLAAVELMEASKLAPFVPLRSAIEDFWLDPANQRASTWPEHLNINEVMLATSLEPSGYLGIS